jgi:hypothetical protein
MTATGLGRMHFRIVCKLSNKEECLVDIVATMSCYPCRNVSSI